MSRRSTGRKPWKLSDPSTWPSITEVVVSDHAMQRAVERLPYGDAPHRELEHYNWIRRQVRRASHDHTMSLTPPGWAHYRGLGKPNKGQAWVVSAHGDTPVLLLVARTWCKDTNVPAHAVVTLITPGTVDLADVMEMAS